ncbi:ArnT family glycosyltransferase [Terriglobus aquaticus]|uniref:ArnT family glycosyltransferase n=1 Tax=Terriglobus aquaticus TaxID=940139 RepID=A0ABW9KHQ8_9BACT|nr:glycosyltransferase family 39 protein [Terriglobus aquaticus]
MRKVHWRGAGFLVAAFLLAGLVLRWYFVQYQPFVAGDSSLYLDISQNWIDAHIYGLSTNAAPRPTLIRLPGYPMVLAAIQLAVPSSSAAPDGSGVFRLLMWLQVLVDLATCVLVSRLAWRNFGRRAGLSALAMSSLCPFLANYTAVPLTECFVLFTVALAFWAADLWRRQPRMVWLVVAALALGYSILLRPDQGLLAAAVIPLFVRTSGERHTWRFALLCASLTLLPLVPWTVRNARTFHVFQPLSPKSATDPGEPYAKGFPHWYRTFAIDFTSTEDAYWNYPEIAVDAADLPTRAYDTPQQRATATRLLHQAAAAKKLRPDVESGFDKLAAERIHAHPFRYYVALPIARLVNMLLHPRIEMLPIDERWWRFRLHPGQTVFATAYAALNLAYMVLAALGLRSAFRVAPALSASMCAFVLLRCALLLTLDNAEQRYTLEFLPVFFFFAAAWFARPPGREAA